MEEISESQCGWQFRSLDRRYFRTYTRTNNIEWAITNDFGCLSTVPPPPIVTNEDCWQLIDNAYLSQRTIH